MFGHALILGILLVSYGGMDIDFMRLNSNYLDVGLGAGWQDTTAHLYPGRTIAFLRFNRNVWEGDKVIKYKKIGISGGWSYNHMSYLWEGWGDAGQGDNFAWLYLHLGINKNWLFGGGVWYYHWTYMENQKFHFLEHPDRARGDYYSHGELSAAWIDTFEVGKSRKIAFSISGGLGASPVPHEWKDKLTGFLAASFSLADSGNRLPIGLKVSLYRPPSASAVLGIEVPLRWKYGGITAGTRLENGVKPNYYVYGYVSSLKEWPSFILKFINYVYGYVSSLKEWPSFILKFINTARTSSSGGKPSPNEQRTNETVSVTVVIKNEAGWKFIPPFALVNTTDTLRNDTLWKYDRAVFQNSIDTTIIETLKVESDSSSSNKISIAEIAKNWELQGIGYYGYRVDSIICPGDTLKFIIRPVWNDSASTKPPILDCRKKPDNGVNQ